MDKRTIFVCGLIVLMNGTISLDNKQNKIFWYSCDNNKPIPIQEKGRNKGTLIFIDQSFRVGRLS